MLFFTSDAKNLRLAPFVELMKTSCFADATSLALVNSRVFWMQDQTRVVTMASVSPDGVVWNVCVDKEMRGRGLAHMLLKHIMATTNGPLRLYVDAVHAGARRLYERVGFRVIAQHGDIVVMSTEK